MNFKQKDNIFFLRLDAGENIIETVTDFLIKNNITNGYFSGIGAVGEAELGYYDLKKKQYSFKTFIGDRDVIGLNGNISLLENKPFIHAHITLSDQDFKAIGGHLKGAVVGASLEIVLVKTDMHIERAFDEKSGLRLWDI